MMTILDAFDHCTRLLDEQRRRLADNGHDVPLDVRGGRRVATIGTLHLYRFTCAGPQTIQEDTPVSLLLPGQEEPIEGLVLTATEDSLLLQTDESAGDAPGAATLVPDQGGRAQNAAQRLADMVVRTEAYHLGTAERLLPLFTTPSTKHAPAPRPVESAAFGAIVDKDPVARRSRLMTQIAELARSNKRMIVLCPTHRAADDLLAALARHLKLLALPYKSLLTRYETDIPRLDGALALQELGFEAQMHQFFARARADKAALRRTYERFRELTPILAYKAEKQKDLNEVKLLEWRLLNQMSDLQGKLKEVKATLEAYESIPVWKRLAMQTMGKNSGTLPDYARLYEDQIQNVMNELEVAQQRINELSPEAAIPKDMRPEYEELKEEIQRVGGTKKIRELIAAEEQANRQAFLQNKRIVVTTPARVATDPLFLRMRFEVMIADEAPMIPAPFLLAAAGLARERLLLTGDPQAMESTPHWGIGLERDSATRLAVAR